MFTETSRGLGRGEPVMDLLLGLIKPSSYAGASKRVKARMDFPYSGNKRLLHHPVKVRYFVVWSQGSVCSSHLNTEQRISINSFQVSYLNNKNQKFRNYIHLIPFGISITSETSMFGKTSISSLRFPIPLFPNSASFNCRFALFPSSPPSSRSRNLLDANCKT